MDRKFCIVLFVAVFYNGVINSTPVKEATSELISKEKHDVSPVAASEAVKVEPTLTPVPDSKTKNSETVTVKNATGTVEGKSVVSNSTVVKTTEQGLSVKNETQAVVTKNDTVATNATGAVVPNAAPATVGVNASSPVPVTDKSLPVPESKPTTTTTTAAPGTEMPRPVAPNQSTTTVSTLNAGTTTAVPVTKPTTVVTSTPTAQTKENAKSTDGVTVEHNSAPEAQGSRFDGASFVGGIVLTVGLTAIGFIAFKYYKSGKIDGNYRTL